MIKLSNIHFSDSYDNNVKVYFIAAAINQLFEAALK